MHPTGRGAIEKRR